MTSIEEWGTQVRRHTLAEIQGPEAAERTLVRSQILAPQLPEDLRGEGLLSWRPSIEGAGHHPRSDEARARDAGLSVKQWRKLSR
jgi:hypothetical protein